tara:strand:- start:327 stop:1196 length:870 start_codon:yes stop_codon:yes gene_type:complete
MSWLTLALTATLIWSVVAILDKFVMSHEMRDPILAGFAFGASVFGVYTLVSLYQGTISTQGPILLPMFVGALGCIGVLLYYFAVNKAEISRIIPLVATMPVYVTLIAFFWLGESFSTMTYAGIGLLVLGGVLISVEKGKHKFISGGLFLAVLATLFWAVRNTLMKSLTLGTSVWNLLFWVGVGSGIVALILLIAHHPHLKKKAKKGVEHLFVNNAVAAIGWMFFAVALEKGPVSLVSSIPAAEPMFVFIAATAISKYHPSIVHEKLSRQALLQKSVSILLIIAGVLLIV